MKYRAVMYGDDTYQCGGCPHFFTPDMEVVRVNNRIYHPGCAPEGKT